MEIEVGEAIPGPPGGLPLPPPPPPPPDADVGPARPPANADLSSAYADPAAYEAYVQASVAYQVRSSCIALILTAVGMQPEACSWSIGRKECTALNLCDCGPSRSFFGSMSDGHECAALQASTDPEYQALLAAQSGMEVPLADDAAAANALSQQQKEAGLASVFKRDDDNLARR